ncbi:MAG: DNA primase [Leptospirales bacterium]
MADEWVESVRRATDLVDVASRYVNLRKRGQKWVGLCPFHEEKSPSFQIDPDKQLYYCFGCHAGGDVFRLVEKLDHKSFGEVVRALAQDAGIALPEWGTGEERERRDRVRKALQAAFELYRKALRSPQGEAARRYLKEERKLSDKSVERFGLGWAPSSSILAETFGDGRAGTDPEGIARALIETGMIKPGQPRSAGSGPGGDLFRSRVMIPIRDREGGAPAGFGGRTLETSGRAPKYINSAESPTFKKREILFGIDHAARAMKREGRVLVVEGYFDVIGLSQAGIENVVAPLGTALGPAHISAIKKHAGEVLLLFDGDRAGREAAMSIIGRFLWDPDLTFRAVWLPDGVDPDSWVSKEGREAVEKALSEALPMGDFVLDWLSSSVARARTSKDPELRANLTRDFLDMVRAFPDLEVQDRLLDRGAVLLGTMKDLLAHSLLSGPEKAKDLRKERLPEEGGPALGNRALAVRNHLVELLRIWTDGESPHPRDIFKRDDFAFVEETGLSSILDELWSQGEGDPEKNGPGIFHDLLKRDPPLMKLWYELPADPGSRQERLEDIRLAAWRMSRKRKRKEGRGGSGQPETPPTPL